MNKIYRERLIDAGFFEDNKLSILELRISLSINNPYISLSDAELDTLDIFETLLKNGEVQRDDVDFKFRICSSGDEKYNLDSIHYYTDLKYLESSKESLLINGRWETTSFKVLTSDKILYSVYLW